MVGRPQGWDEYEDLDNRLQDMKNETERKIHQIRIGNSTYWQKPHWKGPSEPEASLAKVLPSNLIYLI